MGIVRPAADTVTPDEVADIPLNNATLELSDGTDDYGDGDIVIVGDWDETQVAAVVGNLNDGTGLVTVDADVSGDLGGLF